MCMYVSVISVCVSVCLWVRRVFRFGLGLWRLGEGVALAVWRGVLGAGQGAGWGFGACSGVFWGDLGGPGKGVFPGLHSTNRALLNSSGLNTLGPK